MLSGTVNTANSSTLGTRNFSVLLVLRFSPWEPTAGHGWAPAPCKSPYRSAHSVTSALPLHLL